MNAKTTFNGRKYEIVNDLGVGPNTSSELGIVSQQVIRGVRGATRLLQTFDNGDRRTIDLSGNVEIER